MFELSINYPVVYNTITSCTLMYCFLQASNSTKMEVVGYFASVIEPIVDDRLDFQPLEPTKIVHRNCKSLQEGGENRSKKHNFCAHTCVKIIFIDNFCCRSWFIHVTIELYVILSRFHSHNM